MFNNVAAQGCRKGLWKPRLLSFTKKTKNLKSPNFSFLGFLKENLKNSDFRLTVTAENYLQSN